MDTNVIENAADGAKDHRWRRNITGIIAVIVVSVCALAVWGIFQFAKSQQLTTQLAQQSQSFSQGMQQLTRQQIQAAVDGQRLAAQLKALGQEPVVTPPTPVTPQPGQPGPGPTQAEIDDAVSRYFVQHPLPPGQLPPVSEVAGLVAQYLIANPPAPGQDATPQMVSDAVTSYCTGHNGCAGPAGQNGQNATDQQVAQEVSAYCATHNDCAGTPGVNGKDGATGPQGVSITDLVFQRDTSGVCQAIVTLHNPATNTDNTVSHPAGDAACPLLPKPLGTK